MLHTIWEMQNRLCFYCRRPVYHKPSNPADFATADHIIPRARGGHLQPDNIVIACVGCNARRGTTPHLEFLAQVTRRIATTNA